MSLKYILTKFAQRTGIPCVAYNGTEPDEEQVNYALGFVNEGAREIYDAADHVGTMEECIISLNPQTQLTLPSFVGKIRATRELSTYIPWKLSTIRPRYQINSWREENYRNFRDKGIIPIARDVSNTAPPTIIVTQIETPPIEVTIIGSTVNASRISETIVMDALSKTFTQSFTEYEVISKDRINLVDVLIQDADAVELAIIYNHELNSNYRLVDLSQYNTSENSGNITFEILYKKKFKLFQNLFDEFPVPDFDDVVCDKAIQLWAEQRGDAKMAAVYDAKAERTAERKSMDELKGKDLRIEFQNHRHEMLSPRSRGRGWNR